MVDRQDENRGMERCAGLAPSACFPVQSGPTCSGREKTPCKIDAKSQTSWCAPTAQTAHGRQTSAGAEYQDRYAAFAALHRANPQRRLETLVPWIDGSSSWRRNQMERTPTRLHIRQCRPRTESA